jgi:hypothetical protein
MVVMAESVSPHDAIVRSLDAIAAEKGSFYEGALRPMLDEIATRLLEDFDAFGLEVKPKTKPAAKLAAKLQAAKRI